MFEVCKKIDMKVGKTLMKICKHILCVEIEGSVAAKVNYFST